MRQLTVSDLETVDQLVVCDPALGRKSNAYFRDQDRKAKHIGRNHDTGGRIIHNFLPALSNLWIACFPSSPTGSGAGDDRNVGLYGLQLNSYLVASFLPGTS